MRPSDPALPMNTRCCAPRVTSWMWAIGLTGVSCRPVEARGQRLCDRGSRCRGSDRSARLARFERDLIGDGWRVHASRYLAAMTPPLRYRPSAAMVQIRNWLQERYFQDPFGTACGHSGGACADRHSAERQRRTDMALCRMPSDLFYADMDGTWQATPEGLLLETAVPGDFIEMQIGRIDFATCQRWRARPRNRLDQSLFRQEPPLAHGVSGRSQRSLWSEQPPLCRTICAEEYRRPAGCHHRRASRCGRASTLALGGGFRGLAMASDYADEFRQQGGFCHQFRQ